jgi:hypothetical protein
MITIKIPTLSTATLSSEATARLRRLVRRLEWDLENAAETPEQANDIESRLERLAARYGWEPLAGEASR